MKQSLKRLQVHGREVGSASMGADGKLRLLIDGIPRTYSEIYELTEGLPNFNPPENERNS